MHSYTLKSWDYLKILMYDYWFIQTKRNIFTANNLNGKLWLILYKNKFGEIKISLIINQSDYLI